MQLIIIIRKQRQLKKNQQIPKSHHKTLPISKQQIKLKHKHNNNRHNLEQFQIENNKYNKPSDLINSNKSRSLHKLQHIKS